MKIKVPHTFALLFGLSVIAAILTHFLPAGQYNRIESNGRSIVDSSSYHAVKRDPAGITDVFMAYPKGLMEVSHIVFYLFIIGGAFGVINATGAIDSAIHYLVWLSRGNGSLIIPLLTILFSLGGATIGMAEETLPFLPALVVLSTRLGYDETLGGAIALVGAGAGFSGAFLNPFTVGVGQGIAGLPLFSGLGYRAFVWLILTAITVIYLSLYAKRIRKTPKTQKTIEIKKPDVEKKQIAVLGILLLGLAAVVIGSFAWQWGILELAGLFVAITILTGLTGRLGIDGLCQHFVAGAASITGGALVVGLARGVLVIFDQARVTDSILHAMANLVGDLPASISIVGIYAAQVVLSYIVPSGSGQAALSLPILIPLADMVGVTRQTSILAYQFGDGFSNIFTPTQGYFMAALALIKVPWDRWVKFLWPLQCLWLATGLILLLIAHAIRWGPF